MPNIKSNMKDLLSEGLYMIMLQKPFDKITIKQICDKTGVIRGTFYNHFMDKYEALEYLAYHLLIEENRCFLHNKKYNDFLSQTIHTVYEHQEFFYRAFQTNGQNDFESILLNLYQKVIIQQIDEHKLPANISQQFYSSYYANAFVFILKDWILHKCSCPKDEIIARICFLLSKSFYEIL